MKSGSEETGDERGEMYRKVYGSILRPVAGYPEVSHGFPQLKC
jgi:hypothetical protein